MLERPSLHVAFVAKIVASARGDVAGRYAGVAAEWRTTADADNTPRVCEVRLERGELGRIELGIGGGGPRVGEQLRSSRVRAARPAPLSAPWAEQAAHAYGGRKTWR